MDNKKIIVRADFYPDGTVLPLGVTIAGNSLYIDKIVKIIQNIKEKETVYFCISKCNGFVLIYKNGLWFKQ